MNRRTFIRRAGESVAILALPAWLAAFDTKRPHFTIEPKDAPRIAPALDAARKRGRPLLVVLVPPGAKMRAARGTQWGDYLDSATDDDLAVLALCDAVCAEESHVRKELPNVVEAIGANVFALLVETDSASVVKISGDPPPTIPMWTSAEERHAWLLEIRAFFRGILERALVGDEVQLEHRARQGLAILSNEDRDRLTSATVPNRQHAEKIPAWMWKHWGGTASAHPAGVDLLAAQVRTRLLDRPMIGTRWQSFDGCNPAFDDDGPQSPGGPCGTGMCRSESTRFLWMYTQADLDHVIAEQAARDAACRAAHEKPLGK